MKAISRVEQEVNQIRLQIYEETKDLTREQRIARTNRVAEEAAQKFDLNIAASAKDSKNLRANGSKRGF